MVKRNCKVLEFLNKKNISEPPITELEKEGFDKEYMPQGRRVGASTEFNFGDFSLFELDNKTLKIQKNE